MKNNLMKKIMFVLAVMAKVEFGDVWDPDYKKYFWNPATFMGGWNPEGADKIRRFCQRLIYSNMERAGMPLYGWNQFDRFTWAVEDGKTLEDAYADAQEESACYSITVEGGEGTEEDPFLFEVH